MKITMIVLLSLVVSTSVLAQSSIKLVYFNDYPPFSWNENNRMKGIFIDVITEALENEMKLNVSHGGYPWARAQMMVRRNEADAFVTVPTPNRRAYTEISKEPIVNVTFTLFASRNSTRINSLKNAKTMSDLKQFKLVHYIGSGWAKRNMSGMNVFWVPTMDQALFLIANNRYDIFVDVSQVIRFNIKRKFYHDKIVEIPNIIDSSAFYLCIGKKSTYLNILPEFDKIIIKMRENGILQEIYDMYR